MRVVGCGLWDTGKKGIVGRGQKTDDRSQILDNRRQNTGDRGCQIVWTGHEVNSIGSKLKGIEHVEEFGSRNAEVGKRQSPWSQVTSSLKNQSFKRYALYPMSSAL